MLALLLRASAAGGYQRRQGITSVNVLAVADNGPKVWHTVTHELSSLPSGSAGLAPLQFELC